MSTLKLTGAVLEIAPFVKFPASSVKCKEQKPRRYNQRSQRIHKERCKENSHKWRDRNAIYSRKFKNVDEEAFIELLKKVSEITDPINLTIPGIIVDLVNDNIKEAIARYTNGWIYYGIESTRILKRTKKSISIDNIFEAVEIARKHGVKVAGSFIVGYPREEEEDFQATLELADELMLDDY